jgi:hypothetical protein
MLLLGLLDELSMSSAAPDVPAVYGLFRGTELSAAVWVGEDGLLIPSLCEPSDASALGKELAGKVRLRWSLGDPRSVEALASELESGKPRLARPHRLCFASADCLGPFITLGLRRAAEHDLSRLIPLSAGSYQETFEQDPEADSLETAVLGRIRSGKTYVLESGEQLLLKVEVAARFIHGAELAGLFTAPDERFRGHATMALGQLSRELLSSLPRVTMRVDDRAEGLMTVARKVGYSDSPLPQLLLAY